MPWKLSAKLDVCNDTDPAEAGRNHTANGDKTYSNSDPKEISPLSIHCAIYSDVTCASVDGKQSFIVTWEWKEKKRIRVMPFSKNLEEYLFC